MPTNILFVELVGYLHVASGTHLLHSQGYLRGCHQTLISIQIVADFELLVLVVPSHAWPLVILIIAVKQCATN